MGIKIKNTSNNTVKNWTLKVKKSDVNISNYWNMNVKTSGDYYVITPVDWNKSIGKGQSIEIGFVGNGSVGSSVTFNVE